MQSNDVSNFDLNQIAMLIGRVFGFLKKISNSRFTWKEMLKKLITPFAANPWKYCPMVKADYSRWLPGIVAPQFKQLKNLACPSHINDFKHLAESVDNR